MKVLVIGRDPNLFDVSSESFRRIREYADLFEELHLILLEGRRRGATLKTYEGKLFLWPTNSFFPFWRWVDAIFLGLKVAKRYRIDVIDAQDAGESGLSALFVAWVLHLPFRLQIHTDIMSPFYRKASWKEFLRYLIAKFLVKRADCLRVVSKRIKKSLPFRDKIGVLPIFTDVSLFLTARPDAYIEKRFHDHTFKMIAAGRFVDKEKNFSMLLEVMREFKKICPNSLLALAGDGPDKEKYQKQIINYNLQKNVIIEPWRNDLPSFYKSFDIYLLSSWYEGWGRSVIEAMASGLAVIMTDVGLAGEVIKNNVNGLVVPVGDKSAFFAACLRLYQNKDKLNKLAKAGRDTAQQLAIYGYEEYLNRYRQSLELCYENL